MLKHFIVVGSHRKNSQSLKVGKYIQICLEKEGQSVQLLDLGTANIPLWDEDFWSDTPRWTQLWKPISTQLLAADALTVVSPEWSGMAPPALKNFFLLCSKNELAHKPALLVGVSSGISGSYPIAELRMSSFKNTRLCYIPDHVIVRFVETVLNTSPDAENDNDLQIRKRIQYSLSLLQQYALALQKVRESGVMNTKDFPYGM